ISHEDLQAVILHSRINPRFEPMAELLRYHYLTVYQISKALGNGSVSVADATRWLTEEGYPADQIAAFTAEGSKTKVAKQKDISEAQLLQLYEAHEIDRATLAADLANLGYSADEVDPIIHTWDARKILAAQTQAVNYVRKRYLAGRSSRLEASGQLDSLQVS